MLVKSYGIFFINFGKMLEFTTPWLKHFYEGGGGGQAPLDSSLHGLTS